MPRPRFGIYSLMMLVAIAALSFAAARALGEGLCLLALFCWPILTLSGTIWVLEFAGRRPEDGGRSPVVGRTSRRVCGLLILGSRTIVAALGIFGLSSFEAAFLWACLGTLSLGFPAFVGVALLAGWARLTQKSMPVMSPAKRIKRGRTVLTDWVEVRPGEGA